MNTSIKGYIMQAGKLGNRVTTTVYAVSVADAKAIAYAEHGMEFFFKGYQS